MRGIALVNPLPWCVNVEPIVQRWFVTRWRTSALLDLPALESDVPAGILGSDCRCWERRVCFPDVDRLDGFVVDLKLGQTGL